MAMVQEKIAEVEAAGADLLMPQCGAQLEEIKAIAFLPGAGPGQNGIVVAPVEMCGTAS